MMDIFSRESLAQLAAGPFPYSVSIFLPTHRSGSDTRPFAAEDVIRWKNLLREADDRVRATGLSGPDADALLAPARALIDDAMFWQYQGDGLAAFAAPSVFRTFRVPLHLPELVVVAPRFHVTPLLPLLVGDGRFYVLAISQNEVRLIEATRDTAGEVDLAAAPGSLQERYATTILRNSSNITALGLAQEEGARRCFTGMAWEPMTASPMC